MMGRDNRLQQSRRTGALMALVAVAALAGCGGGGGGGGEPPPPPPPPPPGASCTTDVGSFVGVCTGFDSTNLDWSAGGDGSGGVGDGGATGDGGVGAGGDFGQFRNVTITVYRDDGTLLGSAPTDATKGMVTIRPGRSYRGGLRVELRGGPGAEYFEEGKNAFVPFPTDRVIRVIVPRIDQNIGITPFTEAAYQLLTQGTAEESANTPSPTPLQIRAANNRVAKLLNEHFPAALAVRDITRLPFIKSPSVGQGSFNIDERGIYGVVNGAFSKQAALFNTSSSTPTLDAVTQLAEDLRDGKLDGFNGNRPAATAQTRTYDPQTLTSELTAALAQQAERFGSPALRNVLPKLVNFGGTRYEGYLFDTSVTRGRGAVSTVAGWVAANTLNLRVGQANPKALPAGQSVHSMIGNMGHGGAFFKIDSTDTTAAPVNRTYALGDNVNGELGTGNTTSTARQLVEVNLPGAMTHAAGGFAHTVFRLGDGRVFAVGDNTYGQLGQGGAAGTPARAITPVEVPLPAVAGGAVAVAATSVASYALMADGSVYAWGSGGGFGLLGDGQASSVQTAPTLVAGLSEVVQISARDNDVIVLRRDQSILQWGSHPADPGGAYTDGDVTAPYRGGTFAPTAITGLPSETVNGGNRLVPVRKIISEQGLFGVLLANGHVYTWGVHFDLSAKEVLRDLNAARVLGVPPLRDMMPGGFVGYGARPFDRLVAMGVDYSGGMWKIRGRVAEFYDPDSPAQQRRPQTDQPRSANCASCHTFLDQTLEQLRARQAAEAPVPGNAAVCQPPSSVHVSPNGLSFIRAETECIFCHNPSRNDPRYAGVVAPAFAANGGWPNCIKPDNLPPRDNVPARPISNSCVIPPNHVFTPPGTVCSSCHNSVAARALQDLNPPCAQPGANELPSLSATAAINSATNGGGRILVNGGYSSDGTVTLRGTLNAALSSSQVLAVLRNGVTIGNATLSGTNWLFSEAGLASGITATYAARVVEGSGFGATSNSFTVRVDYTPPAVSGQVTGISDDIWGPIADGNFATDTTPTISGTLSGIPDSGDTIQVLRNGVIEGTPVVTGTSWTFTEPAPLSLGGHFYQLRVIDTAGNISTIGTGRSITLISGVGTASIGAVSNSGGTPVPPGSVTNNTTLVLTGTISTALLPGQVVRVLRNGVLVDSAPYVGQNWSFTDTAPEGGVSYTVRVDAGAVRGSLSASYDITVDSVVPTQVATVTQISDDFVGALPNPGTTADQTPTVSGTLSAALGSGERIQLRRTNTATGATVNVLLTPAGNSWSYTETALVPAGTYAYQTQVFDLAANATGFTAARTVTIDPTAIPLPGAAATISTINGVAPTGAPASVGLSNDPTPTLAGTIQRALNAGEVVRVFRNSTPLPTAATVTGTNWSLTNGTLADGTYTFTARVEQASNSAVFGQTSASAAVTIDATAPTQTVGPVSISDPALISVTNGNSTSSSHIIIANISAALGPNELVQVVRTGGTGPVVFNPPIQNSSPPFTWVVNDTASPLTVGVTYTYTASVVDGAGNQGPPSVPVTVTRIAPLPTINTIGVSGSTGGFVNTTTPTITGSVSASLPVGAVLRVYRGTNVVAPAVGNATFTGLNWSITDANVGQGPRTYVARVEFGTAVGSLTAPVTVIVDSLPPSQTINVAQVRSDYAPTSFVPGAVPQDASIANGGNTNDATPVFRIALNAALGSGESIEVRRGAIPVTVSLTEIATTACGAGAAACYEFSAPTAVTVSTNMVSTTGLPAPGTPGTFQTMGSATFTARVVDQAQNTGPASTGYAVNVGYFLCSQQRASAAASAAPNPIAHPTIGAGQNPAQRCSSCHSLVSPADPAVGGGTAAGNFVAVPVTNPLYWCRRPS